MKRQDIVALRQKTPVELREQIAGLSKTLVETRVKRGLGQVKNVKEEYHLKKDIARIKTVLKELELTGVKQEDKTA